MVVPTDGKISMRVSLSFVLLGGQRCAKDIAIVSQKLEQPMVDVNYILSVMIKADMFANPYVLHSEERNGLLGILLTKMDQSDIIYSD